MTIQARQCKRHAGHKLNSASWNVDEDSKHDLVNKVNYLSQNITELW